MKSELIAPCGMNCIVCSNYLALVNDIFIIEAYHLFLIVG